MKRVLAVFIVIAELLILCSCGAGNSSSATSDVTVSTETEPHAVDTDEDSTESSDAKDESEAVEATEVPQESTAEEPSDSSDSIEAAQEPEEVLQESESDRPITNDGTLTISINDFAEAYQSSIDSIDDNLAVEITGLSSEKIEGYFTSNKTDVIGLLSFKDKDGNDIGGKGDKENVIRQINVTSVKKGSDGNLVSDSYQISVLYPAAMMAIDKSLSYDDACDLLKELEEKFENSEGTEGAERNGVAYLLAPLYSDTPDINSLYIIAMADE